MCQETSFEKQICNHPILCGLISVLKIRNTEFHDSVFFYLFMEYFCDKIQGKERSFYMKKIMNKINFAIIGLMVAMPAFADELNAAPYCELFKKLHDVFRVLQILAFVGAAFYIAGWAWGFISSGKAEVKDLKEKGTALLVGFVLLFMIGVVLTFVLSVSGMKIIGCPILEKW